MALHDQTTFECIVIGAGLSGINAAYRLQERLGRDFDYTLLERRQDLGGTWSFFQYPGLRSDSDLFSYGFPFRPWEKESPIADGPSILAYLRGIAADSGIDRRIQYGQRVTKYNWLSQHQQWAVDVEEEPSGRTRRLYARVVVVSTGYYSYDEPRRSDVPGLKEHFRGDVIHTQAWPRDYDLAGKRVVVIGSGATAITLVPAIADQAASVVQLQRSPSYVRTILQKSWLDGLVRACLPRSWAHGVLRAKYALDMYGLVMLSHAVPGLVRRFLRFQTRRQLKGAVDMDPHFNPAYRPWDQRLCMCPNGDYFAALADRKAHIVTGHVKTCDATGLILTNGEHIDADTVVTATGLKIQFIGGAALHMDGEPVDIGQHYAWRSAMFNSIPNLIWVMGYPRDAWTLASDPTAQIAAHVLDTMKKRGSNQVTVEWGAGNDRYQDLPIFDLQSNYLVHAEGAGPKTSNRFQWTPRTNWLRDWFTFNLVPINWSLTYRTVPV